MTLRFTTLWFIKWSSILRRNGNFLLLIFFLNSFWPGRDAIDDKRSLIKFKTTQKILLDMDNIEYCHESSEKSTWFKCFINVSAKQCIRLHSHSQVDKTGTPNRLKLNRFDTWTLVKNACTWESELKFGCETFARNEFLHRENKKDSLRHRWVS